ncbi:type I toxin-antitoxin system Ibs family toxin [Escherichia coli]|nr:type I toxin-antitoxin system Ibs family toxin [Escherichia coli]EFL9476703.1 type I toxin-antitoxin system Ibs family toxin [Escherichia coli]EFN4264201.1 type I toxin-antitoxin system Ibs family toxin [Escherichia coli]MGJ51247.1 type I toxin-antitoxin system Ibs family toxin [Escherichia coli]
MMRLAIILIVLISFPAY